MVQGIRFNLGEGFKLEDHHVQFWDKTLHMMILKNKNNIKKKKETKKNKGKLHENYHVRHENYSIFETEKSKGGNMIQFNEISIDTTKDRWLSFLCIDTIESFNEMEEYINRFNREISELDLEPVDKKQESVVGLKCKGTSLYVLVDPLWSRLIPIYIESKHLLKKIQRIIEMVSSEFFLLRPGLELFGDNGFRVVGVKLKGKYDGVSRKKLKMVVYGRIYDQLMRIANQMPVGSKNRGVVLDVARYMKWSFFNEKRKLQQINSQNRLCKAMKNIPFDDEVRLLQSAYKPGYLKDSTKEFAKELALSFDTNKIKLGLVTAIPFTIAFPRREAIALGLGPSVVNEFVVNHLGKYLKSIEFLKSILKDTSPLYNDTIYQYLHPEVVVRIESELYKNEKRTVDINGNTTDGYYHVAHIHGVLFINIPYLMVKLDKVFQLMVNYTVDWLYKHYQRVKQYVGEQGISNWDVSWHKLKKKLLVRTGNQKRKYDCALLSLSVLYEDTKQMEVMRTVYELLQEHPEHFMNLSTNSKVVKQLSKLASTLPFNIYNWFKYSFKLSQQNFVVVANRQYKLAASVKDVLSKVNPSELFTSEDIYNDNNLDEIDLFNDEVEQLIELGALDPEDTQKKQLLKKQRIEDQAIVWRAKSVDGEVYYSLPPLAQLKNRDGSEIRGKVSPFFVFEPMSNSYVPIIELDHSFSEVLPEVDVPMIHMIKVLGHKRLTKDANLRCYTSKTLFHLDAKKFLVLLSKSKTLIYDYLIKLKEKKQKLRPGSAEEWKVKKQIRDLELLIRKLEIQPLLAIKWSMDLYTLATSLEVSPELRGTVQKIYEYLGLTFSLKVA